MSAEIPFGQPDVGEQFSAPQDATEASFVMGDHKGLDWREAMESDASAARVIRLLAITGIEAAFQPVLPLPLEQN